MAIEKKLIHFGKLADFEAQLTAGNILDRSIVFIQDAKKIWTHGTYYDCSDGTDVPDSVYVTDFTVNDLLNLVKTPDSVLSADFQSMCDAMVAHKVVLVPYDTSEGYAGYGIANGYREDLFYFSVKIEGGRCIEVEVNDYSQLRSDDLYIATYVREERLRTINGQTLLGDGDITVGGEDNVQSDWNVTNSSSDAYIKNKPTIPTKVSDLEDDRGLVSEQFARDLFIGRDKSNAGCEVANFDQIFSPDISLLYALPASANGDEDDVLLSRNTVKTINGESILGSGDLTIEGGAKIYEWFYDGESESVTLSQEEYDNIVEADLVIVKLGMLSFTVSKTDKEFAEATGEYVLVGQFDFQGNKMYIQIVISIATKLATITIEEQAIPTKTSELENDSNFITSDGLKTINGESIVGSGDIAIQGGSGTITEVKANGTSVATSGVANIPAASTSAYGVTKLSSATNSTSTTLAATASAVKTAYDLANSYKGTVTGVKVNGTTKSPSSGVVDLGTVITSHQDISGKQDKLVSGTNIKTINGTSILGSGNITISGGGSSSGGSGAYSEVNHGTSDTTFALTPNTFHIWDEVANLTLTLGSETSGVANEYLFQFTSGATATTLSLPYDLKWANDTAPTIEPNMIYQVSILKGLASVLEFSNSNTQISIFYIDGTEYQMDEGMTWEEWVNSKYNIAGFYIDYMPWSDTYVIATGGDFNYGTIIDPNGDIISKSDLILSGYEYEIYYEGTDLPDPM